MTTRVSTRSSAKLAPEKRRPDSIDGIEPSVIEPDLLRERVQTALWNLAPDDQQRICVTLLASLEQAGVNLPASLLILGIPARAPDDLTPPGMAKLIRYIRINFPAAIQAIAGPLAELLDATRARTRQVSKRAA
jgi:hypothetical protein